MNSYQLIIRKYLNIFLFVKKYNVHLKNKSLILTLETIFFMCGTMCQDNNPKLMTLLHLLNFIEKFHSNGTKVWNLNSSTFQMFDVVEQW